MDKYTKKTLGQAPGTLIYIGEQKTQIEELITTQKELKEEYEEKLYRLKTILDSIPGSVYWKDKSGVFFGQNKFAENKLKLVGLPHEVIGKSNYEIFSKKVADKYRANDLKVMTDEIEFSEEEEVTTANGDRLVQLSSKQPLRDKKGKVIGIIGNTIDITELKKIEQELNAEILLQDMLDYATINPEAKNKNFAKFNLRESIKSLQQKYRKALKAVDIDFSLNYESKIQSQVLGDKRCIEMLLDNLLGTAGDIIDKGNIILDVFERENEAMKKPIIILRIKIGKLKKDLAYNQELFVSQINRAEFIFHTLI